MGRGGRGYEIRIFHLVCIALLSAFTGACGKILGVDGYSVGGGPRADAGGSSKPGAAFDFVDPTCGKCMKAKCPTELAKCRNDRLCGPWQDRMAQCKTGDTGCQHDCYAKAGATNPAIGDAAVCSWGSCWDECSVSIASGVSSSCADQVVAQCGDEDRKCFADATCRDYWRCLVGSNCLLLTGDSAVAGVNPTCEWQCGDRYGPYVPVSEADGGVQNSAMAADNLCIYERAYSACNLGDLSCTLKYPSPTPSSSQIAVKFSAHTQAIPEVQGTPLGGIPIRACLSQTDCLTDYGHDTTDGQGHAEISLPRHGLGESWYFEVTPLSSWPNGPSKMLFYSGRPLIQPTTISLAMDEADFSDVRHPGAGARVGDVWNRDKAALWVFTRSCYNSLADGLEIRVTGLDGGIAGTPLYNGTRPTPCGTSCGSSATGWAYFSDMEPGVVTVSAYDDRGTKVAEEPVVITKADSVTILNWLEPLRSP
jgi:hypothetical protein